MKPTANFELDRSSSENFKVGGEYELFNVTKESPVKLKMPKNSYAKKIKMNIDAQKETCKEMLSKTIRLVDLMKKNRKATVKDNLIAKVFEIKDRTKTSKGNRIP